jgi:hypothetical protein
VHFIIVLLAAMVAAKPIPTVTAEQAEALAVEAVKSHDHQPIFEPYPGSPNSGFCYFEELNPNPNTSAYVATIAVNKWTGDVWDVEGSVCHLLIASKKTRVAKSARIPNECEISN